MAPDFVIRQGTLLPRLTATLTDGRGRAVSLGTAQVTFAMYRDFDRALVIADTPATVEDAALGTVSYGWVDGDTDEAGVFLAAFEVVSGPSYPIRTDLVVHITERGRA